MVFFESVEKILNCEYLTESYRAILSCGVIYYAAQGFSNFLIEDNEGNDVKKFQPKG